MKFLPFISSLAAGACLALSIWLFLAGRTSIDLQAELQRQQDSLQAQQLEVQLQRQKFQAQQDQINTAAQLAQQVGPAVVRDLGSLMIENKNDKIEALLAKHGVSVTQSSPSPSPAPER